jgi:predicted PurR-regulated permease PerM
MTRAQASVLVLLGLLLALLWLAPEVPLLGFAALLLAIALRAPAEWVAAHTGMRRRVAVLVLLGVILAGLAWGAWTAWDPLVDQANQLLIDLPRGLAALRDQLEHTRLGAWLVERLRPAEMVDGQGAISQAAAAASGTLSVLGNAALVALIAVYMAVRPRGYLGGLGSLFHPSLDGPVRDILAECGHVLRGFLLGQGFAMMVSGTLTWIGLLLLGVPLAGVLAVITAILGFIPVLGPVIAAVPAMLLALTQSPTMALYVALLFFAVQFIEGNILTPNVQAAAADLPPALLLLMQVLMGALFGLLGVALAAPAAAVGLMLVRRAYVEGWLGRAKPPEDADR